jgi:hypothetical protein
METVLKAWDASGLQKSLRIPHHERSWLIILFRQFYKYPETLNILSLAHIVFYIEKNYFRVY